MRKKVTVIGAGNVGATCAQRIVENDLADVILIDIDKGLAEGKAVDIMQSAHLLGFKKKIVGTDNFKAGEGSSVIIVTAGLARKPGMTRDDLLKKNGEIVKDTVSKAAPLSKNSVIIVVTNPLDVMCSVAQKYSGFPYSRVIGMAGELDKARFSYFLRLEKDADPMKIKSVVLGTHGDAMAPMPRFTKIGSKKIGSIFSSRKIKGIIEKTRKGGAQIVNLLKRGSAYYAPSAAAFVMARAVLNNTGETFVSSVYLNGEYGISGTYCGVPVKLGKKGVIEIVELPLDSDERELLLKSAEAIKNNIEKVKGLGI